MAEIFDYDRQAGAAGKIVYRVREVKFGDGYSQVVADGINNRYETWPLSFEGNLAQMREILAFFDRHTGNRSFYWTPPTSDDPLLFRCTEVSFTSVGAGIYRVSADFQQVYSL